MGRRGLGARGSRTGTVVGGQMGPPVALYAAARSGDLEKVRALLKVVNEWQKAMLVCAKKSLAANANSQPTLMPLKSESTLASPAKRDHTVRSDVVLPSLV